MQNPTIEMEIMGGTSVTQAAKEMVAKDQQAKTTVTASFNGVNLTATAETSPADIVGHYHTELERQSTEWRNSAEGQAYARRQEAEFNALQVKCGELLKQLATLDFSNLSAVIDWLYQFQEPSNRIGIRVPHELIVRTFQQHGYEPNANLGDQFDTEDRENVARYLIGQALDGLQCHVHAIHQVFLYRADEWRQKFETTKV